MARGSVSFFQFANVWLSRASGAKVSCSFPRTPRRRSLGRSIGRTVWRCGWGLRGLAAKWAMMGTDGEEVAIHIAEMLSFLAFACKVAHQWSGKVILYGGDNQVVREWIGSRKSGVAAGRTLIRVLNMLEMRHRCLVVPAWFRTFHNAHADYVTRCSPAQFDDLVSQKGWQIVHVAEELHQALVDSEKFGPCILAWAEDDRQELMKSKEGRLQRQVPQWAKPQWHDFMIVELAGPDCFVLDFMVSAKAIGCRARAAECP